MPKIYRPTSGPDDWRSFLAKPDKQWKSGFSAKTLAYCWERADGLPHEIAAVLRPHGGDAELLIAIPEYKVPLAGAARGDSQNDVFALVRVGDRTFTMMIEGKVNEPFSETLNDWLMNASEGKRRRLDSICNLLGLASTVPGHIYYQLLHRTASAVIEAERFKTDAAAMIVHSFSPERMRFEDFVKFVALFGVVMTPDMTDQLILVRPDAKRPLYIGWVCGDCGFLNA